MLKYDKLNKNFNFLQRSYEKLHSSMSSRNSNKFSKKDFNPLLVQVTENHPKDDDEDLNMKKKSVQAIPSSTNDFRIEKVEFENKERSTSQKLDNESSKFTRRKESSRARRSILMLEKRNSTDVDSWLESDESDDDWQSSEYRTTRARRDEGRGKKERKNKNKRRPKRSRRRLGTFVVFYILYFS